VLQAVERLVGARRNEFVQFQPRTLAADTDMDADSVAAALRELNQLASFTYVPPFRGRAIRMIRRDVPFDQLDIDFAEQEARKADEYEKLDKVIRFALGGSCRQGEILRYFGEEDAPRCGHCDNCRRNGSREASPRQGDRQPAAAAPDAAVVETVRIILSGVARTVARFPCGKNLIAQMLCGSGSARMAKLRLNQLSTFGLLAHLKQTEVVTLIEALIATGYLQQSDLDRFRPVVELTERGNEVMRGQQPLSARLPIPADVLCKLRAPRPGFVPKAVAPAPAPLPETGVHDTTLARSASEGPATANPGLSPAGSRVEPASSRPPHYWTWRLLSAGFTLDECAATRGLTADAVLDHALRAIEEGWPVEARWCLGAELVAAVAAAVGDDEPRQIRPLLAQLPPGTTYQQVEIFLKCRRAGSPKGRNRVK
jgi:ATP-dependent DNA helicase RecQ